MQLCICNSHPVAEVIVVNSLEELTDYKEEWDKILIDNNNSNPFLEFEWIESWWNIFGKGHSLFVLVMKMEERIVGFCPFMIIKKRFLKEIAFIGHPESLYMEFILAKEGGAQCIKSALDYIINLKGNYLLHLNGLFDESDTFKILENYFTKNKNKFFIRKFEDPYLGINEDFTSYLKKCSHHNAIKTLIKNKKN